MNSILVIGTKQVELATTQGEWSELDRQEHYDLDLSELVPGIYILEINTKDGHRRQKKIIKIE